MRDVEPGFLPSVRYLTNTAAALPVNHIARLRELFPGARLYSMYGLTECKRCTYLPPDELDRRPGSVLTNDSQTGCKSFSLRRMRNEICIYLKPFEPGSF